MQIFSGCVLPISPQQVPPEASALCNAVSASHGSRAARTARRLSPFGCRLGAAGCSGPSRALVPLRALGSPAWPRVRSAGSNLYQPCSCSVPPRDLSVKILTFLSSRVLGRCQLLMESKYVLPAPLRPSPTGRCWARHGTSPCHRSRSREAGLTPPARWS